MTIDTNTPATVAKPSTSTKKAAPRVLQPVADAKPMLKPLSEDESASRNCEVDATNKRVVDTYAFKLNKDSKERYLKTTTFDFSGVSNEELYELATATVRIVTQRNLRTLNKGALDPSAYATVDVKKEIIDAQPRREQLDPTTKAVRALMAAANLPHEVALRMVEDAQKGNQNAKK